MSKRNGPNYPQQKQGRQVAITQTQWQSPVPPPDVLEKYETVYAGSTERIFEIVENQATHRQAMEVKFSETQRLAVQNNHAAAMAAIEYNKRKQYFAFAVILVGFVFAAYLVHSGDKTTGIVSFFVELGALAGLFVYSENKAREPTPKP